jgi:F0F1-type ATP synthase epsilon subunit
MAAGGFIDMKTRMVLMLASALTLAQAQAADEAEKKKPAAEKKAAAKKSDKNVFQKAESGTGDFLHRNKLWTRQEKKKEK